MTRSATPRQLPIRQERQPDQHRRDLRRTRAAADAGRRRRRRRLRRRRRRRRDVRLRRAADNCRIDRNPDQEDADGDGFGDVCPPVDSDSDGVINDDDNCDFAANPDQQDVDGDDRGDVCDRDLDGDRFDNEFDNCPTVYNIEATDTDGDGLINDQPDADGDGIGTACDPDESAITPPGGVERPRRRRSRERRSNRRSASSRAGMIVRMRCSEACAATARGRCRPPPRPQARAGQGPCRRQRLGPTRRGGPHLRLRPCRPRRPQGAGARRAVAGQARDQGRRRRGQLGRLSRPVTFVPDDLSICR